MDPRSARALSALFRHRAPRRSHLRPRALTPNAGRVPIARRSMSTGPSSPPPPAPPPRSRHAQFYTDYAAGMLPIALLGSAIYIVRRLPRFCCLCIRGHARVWGTACLCFLLLDRGCERGSRAWRTSGSS